MRTFLSLLAVAESVHGHDSRPRYLVDDIDPDRERPSWPPDLVTKPHTRVSVDFDSDRSLFHRDQQLHRLVTSPMFDAASRYQYFGSPIEFGYVIHRNYNGSLLRVSTLHYNATRRKVWFETRNMMDVRELDTTKAEYADVPEGLLVELINKRNVTIFEAPRRFLFLTHSEGGSCEPEVMKEHFAAIVHACAGLMERQISQCRGTCRQYIERHRHCISGQLSVLPAPWAAAWSSLDETCTPLLKCPEGTEACLDMSFLLARCVRAGAQAYPRAHGQAYTRESTQRRACVGTEACTTGTHIPA